MTLMVVSVIVSLPLNAKTLSIQVKKSVLKASPSFLGKNLITLTYGDKVSELDSKDDWIKVSTKSKKGWLHSSALTDKVVVLKNTSKKAISGVSSDEMVLAGKGFNKQVESKYRKDNPKMRFDSVDKMEKYSVSSQSQRAFAKSGKLKY